MHINEDEVLKLCARERPKYEEWEIYDSFQKLDEPPQVFYVTDQILRDHLKTVYGKTKP